MISQTYAPTPSGLLLPARNGFMNRLIIKTPGAFSFALPIGIATAKVALFGGGGAGALGYFYTSTYLSTPGGAGGGFAQKLLTGIGGLTITGTVGAAGLGGALTTAASTNAVLPGGNGGTTTLSVGSYTLSATGGAGGGVPKTAATPGALGGIGSGGDLNFQGGAGGGCVAGSNTSGTAVYSAGGGASGSPNGPGGAGGSTVGYGEYGCNGAGGGWGGDGASSGIGTSSGSYWAHGGGSVGPGFKIPAFSNVSEGHNSGLYSRLGGAGRWPVISPSRGASSSTSSPSSLAELPLDQSWWDLDEIGGWGSTYLAPGAFFNTRRNRYGIDIPGLSNPSMTDGQDGAGGGAYGSENYGSAGGFGGGSAGCRLSTYDFYTLPTRAYQSPVPGGLAAGAGGLLCIQGSGGAGISLRSNDGGPGCVIIWF